MKLLDCTLRDGGYYNDWDFSVDVINRYLDSMQSVGVDVVELGFRSLNNQGFKGPCAFASDDFIKNLKIPSGLAVSIMINASELLGEMTQERILELLMPNLAENSPVSLVRIACHLHEFEKTLSAVTWLKDRGYQVGFNLMQVADRTEGEIVELARKAANYPLDVLYFADSMGSMNPDQVAQIMRWFRVEWKGAIGIHTHDNLGLGLSNTLRAIDEGATWVDSTVTGMGRGPGNTRTEEIAIEIAYRSDKLINLAPLINLIREHFKPMQQQFGWGTNPYYYLAGKYGIHPTYIQEMLNDSRYDAEDVLAVIEYLRMEGGKKFKINTLEAARHFYRGAPKGQWSPRQIFAGRDVLLMGSGPSATHHRDALERFIRNKRPLVIALNTQCPINAELIDFRVACHPIRLLTECKVHLQLSQPLITPYSMLPADLQAVLANKDLLDFGMSVQADTFEFADYYCIVPTSQVIAYTLAFVTSGKAETVLMAGFDGYGADDPRSQEMESLFECYQASQGSLRLSAITPTHYRIHTQSVYAL